MLGFKKLLGFFCILSLVLLSCKSKIIKFKSKASPYPPGSEPILADLALGFEVTSKQLENGTSQLEVVITHTGADVSFFNYTSKNSSGIFYKGKNLENALILGGKTQVDNLVIGDIGNNTFYFRACTDTRPLYNDSPCGEWKTKEFVLKNPKNLVAQQKAEDLSDATQKLIKEIAKVPVPPLEAIPPVVDENGVVPPVLPPGPVTGVAADCVKEEDGCPIPPSTVKICPDGQFLDNKTRCTQLSDTVSIKICNDQNKPYVKHTATTDHKCGPVCDANKNESLDLRAQICSLCPEGKFLKDKTTCTELDPKVSIKICNDQNKPFVNYTATTNHACGPACDASQKEFLSVEEQNCSSCSDREYLGKTADSEATCLNYTNCGDRKVLTQGDAVSDNICAPVEGPALAPPVADPPVADPPGDLPGADPPGDLPGAAPPGDLPGAAPPAEPDSGGSSGVIGATLGIGVPLALFLVRQKRRNQAKASVKANVAPVQQYVQKRAPSVPQAGPQSVFKSGKIGQKTGERQKRARKRQAEALLKKWVRRKIVSNQQRSANVHTVTVVAENLGKVEIGDDPLSSVFLKRIAASPARPEPSGIENPETLKEQKVEEGRLKKLKEAQDIVEKKFGDINSPTANSAKRSMDSLIEVQASFLDKILGRKFLQREKSVGYDVDYKGGQKIELPEIDHSKWEQRRAAAISIQRKFRRTKRPGLAAGDNREELIRSERLIKEAKLNYDRAKAAFLAEIESAH
jgi:hypothetical protein